MLTLNQIIDQVQDLATAHAQIGSSGVGTLAEWQAKPDRTYPLLWVFHERTDVSDQYFTYRLHLLAMDRVKVGESGEDTEGHEQEVISDMQSVLLDFLAWFAQQHTQTYIVERAGSIEPFTERGNDRVAGCSYILNIKQPWDFAKCSVPESGAVIPPSVDGLTLYDFCDASVLARLTPAQVACLEAAYGTACDPVTVEINGTEVGTPASGSTFSIKVTLDGSESGSWDGTDTWEVESDPCNSLSLSASDTTPDYNASYTVTATATGFTPTSYTFSYPIDSNGCYSRTTQAGNALAITARGYGAQTVIVTATDGVTTVGATIEVNIQDTASVVAYLANIPSLSATEINAARQYAYRSFELGLTATAIYPFRGATSANTKWNLANSGNSMTWNGGWTFNSNGVTANGVNSNGDTGINGNTFGQNSIMFVLYNRTDGASGIDIIGAITPRVQFAIKWTVMVANAVYDFNNGSTANSMPTPTDVRGFWAAWRFASNALMIYHKGPGGERWGYATTASSAPASGNIKLSAGAIGVATNRNYAFFAMYSAPTSSHSVLDLEQVVNAQMTALGINVY